MKHLKTTLLASLLSLQTATAAVIEKPWLRDHLPEKITAYARIPNPKFYFADTDTTKNPAAQQAIYAPFIQSAAENLFTQLSKADMPAEAKAALKVLLTQLNAPVELMVTDFSDGKAPPMLLIATQLRDIDGESITKLFQQLSKDSPLAVTPTSANQGTLMARPMGIPGQYGFDPKTGRLLLVVGSPDPAALEKLHAKTPSVASPIRSAEAQIDASGTGLFAWVKPNPMFWMQMPLSPEDREIIETLKLTELRKLAIGIGVGDKRPKLKALLNMPNVGLRQLIPAHDITVSPTYHGHLSSIFSLSLPNESQLDAMARFATQSQPEKYAEYMAFKQKMAAETGVQFSTLMQFIGHQLLIFSDDNGQFLVLPATAEPAMEALLSQLSNKGLTLIRNQLDINGTTIQHLSLQKVTEQFVEKDQSNLSKSEKALLPLASQLYLPSNHIYWVKNGDHLIFSSLPQPLIAHLTTTPSGTTNQWLAKQQLTLDGSFMSGLMTLRNLSQQSYYGHLQLLQLLADVSKTPLDITKFPPANQLSLPRYGAMALQIHNGGDALSLEYSTENGFSDIWQAIGNSYTLTTVGILAAVAVPAYHDYTARAQVHAVSQDISAIKEEILYLHLSQNIPLSDINYPVEDEVSDELLIEMSDADAATAIVESAIEAPGMAVAEVAGSNDQEMTFAELSILIDSVIDDQIIEDISVESGRIVVTLGASMRKLWGENLTYIPTFENGELIDWQCTHDQEAPTAKLPTSCHTVTPE